MQFKYKDVPELRLAIRELSADIVSSSINFQLHKSILQQARLGYAAYMDHAPAFWSLAIDALITQSLLCIGRAYDEHSGALSLPNYLCLLEKQPAVITELMAEVKKERNDDPELVEPPFELAQLKADIAAVSKKHGSPDKMLNKLLELRNRTIAHKDYKQFMREAPLVIEYADVEQLIERALIIFNRWANLFTRNSYSGDLIGSNDFKSVLSAVKAAVDLQMAEYGAEPHSIAPENGEGPVAA